MNKNKKRSERGGQSHEPHGSGGGKEGTDRMPDAQRNDVVVGLGASAGGLDAFEQFFKKMPSDSGAAFVIITHLDPHHHSMLGDIIGRYARMKVQTIEDEMPVQPNIIYIIPSSGYAYLEGSALHLVTRKEKSEKNLPIDMFFRSLAVARGENAVAIVLSGTGTDGTLGVKDVKEHLGLVIAQDLISAKYNGMPKSVIDSGHVDYVLPPSEMPAQILKFVHQRITVPEEDLRLEETRPESIRRILSLVRAHTGNDFSNYKTKTITRRVERRMEVLNLGDLPAYIRHLRSSPAEIEQLQKDLLISVTRFFRDPEAFATLKERVLNDLLPRKKNSPTLRVWIPACATGEEAYSIAIILQECLEETKMRLDVQVFGTDIDVDAIEKARLGSYLDNISGDVGTERLSKYFTFESGRYRVKKSLRETVVFAIHNALNDPPFSRTDLVSCRNLLIYLDPKAQQRLATVFAYSCNPGALLFLGASESLSPFSEFFKPLDDNARIAERMKYPSPMVASSTSAPRLPGNDPSVNARGNVHEAMASDWKGMIPQVERFLLDRLAPPTVIINSSGEVIYVHGDTGKYLRPAIGQVTNDIVSMARKDIRSYLSSGILGASKERKENEVKNIKIDVYGHPEKVSIKVMPIVGKVETEGLLAVVFEEVPPARYPKRKDHDQFLQECEEAKERLNQTEKQLVAVTTELGTSREEIRSLNEEMESTNEEFQSTSEELETSREELQSVNEELLTVNNELQQRLESLATLNADMKNLLNNTDIAIIFLDTKLMLRRFTEPATKFIRLVQTDTGRPLSAFSTNIKGVNLAESAKDVVDTLKAKETEVQSTDGEWYLLRMLPYRTEENAPDGVVITFVSIASRKKAEEELARAAEDAKRKTQQLEAIFRSMREGLLEINVSGRVEYANPAALRQLGVGDVEEYVRALEIRTLDGKAIPPNDRPVGNVIGGTPISNQEVQIRNKRTKKTFIGSLNGNPVIDQNGVVTSAILTIRDITGQKRTEDDQKKERGDGGKRSSDERGGP